LPEPNQRAQRHLDRARGAGGASGGSGGRKRGARRRRGPSRRHRRPRGGAALSLRLLTSLRRLDVVERIDAPGDGVGLEERTAVRGIDRAPRPGRPEIGRGRASGRLRRRRPERRSPRGRAERRLERAGEKEREPAARGPRDRRLLRAPRRPRARGRGADARGRRGGGGS
jgi:hypothetical protein